ncbi:MAG TPA: response regulator [Candidatus Polarisedimenticolia bacterium]|jgi:CheY-like chemotaxis protein
MKRKIFLADDSITIQKVVELTFPEADYEVTCVSSGAQAIDKIRMAVPDIALLDVIMPERNGYEICAQVKQDPELKWMPVLLISGAFEPYDEKRAAEVGANGRLTKPFESRALVAKVEDLMTAHPHPGRPIEAPRPASVTGASVPPSPRPAPPAQTAFAPASAQTVRMSAREPYTQTPQGPSSRPMPAPQPPAPPPPVRTASVTPARSGAQPASTSSAPAAASPVPAEAIDRAVREAVAGISEKVVREVAWEVIPDLAEAIILRRIRELEEEAGGAK